MHVTHTKHKHKGKFKVVCDPNVVLASSVHEIQRFCLSTNTYIEINNGINMAILPESEE